MKLRKLAFLGSVLAGAAYLRDKNRRDRFMDNAGRFLDSARNRISAMQQRRQGAVAGSEEPLFTHDELGGTRGQPAGTGAGYGGTPGGNGLY